MNNKERLDELYKMGLHWNGKEHEANINGLYINVHYTEIVCDDEPTWRRKMEQIRLAIKKNKEHAK